MVATSIVEKSKVLAGTGSDRADEAVKSIHDEMVELLLDEEITVRSAALEGSIALIRRLDVARRKAIANVFLSVPEMLRWWI